MQAGPLVILTQEVPDNARLAAMLDSSGINSFNYPCVATAYIPFDPEAAIPGGQISTYEVIAFTSKRGVIGFAPAARLINETCPAVACVGEATALEAKQRLNVEDTIVPAENYTATGLAEEIIRRFDRPGPVLHVRGNKTTGTFKQVLGESGWQVDELIVYENTAPEIAPLLDLGAVVAVFASPSAAQRFFAVNVSMVETTACVAIGPVTADCLRDIGVRRVRQALEASLHSLAEMIVESVSEEDSHGA